MRRIDLSNESWVTTQKLDDDVVVPAFEDVWSLRPAEPQHVVLYGKQLEIPRRQLAFGRSYTFSGQTSTAHLAPQWLDAVKDGVEKTTGAGFNGILMNFYEGDDYIGPHSDDEKQLVRGHPICTLSLGGARRFVLAEKQDKKKFEFVLNDRDVLMMHGKCQREFKHHVKKPLKKDAGSFRQRRVSITFRKFA